jgi:hypothetical protein
VKKFEYRAVTLRFSHDGNLLPPLGANTEPMLLGERVHTTLGNLELNNSDGAWWLTVLLERETSAFTVGDMNRDELNKILKGEA